MKVFIILIIKLYWWIIPASKRKQCLFKESCSKYVYRIAKQQGLLKGINAFKLRYYQCRPNYKVIKNEIHNCYEFHLSNGEVVKGEYISPEVLKGIY